MKVMDNLVNKTVAEFALCTEGRSSKLTYARKLVSERLSPQGSLSRGFYKDFASS
jgi:hypothetical protein